MCLQLRGHLRTVSFMQTEWSLQATLVSYNRCTLTVETWSLIRTKFYPTIMKGRDDETI